MSLSNKFSIIIPPQDIACNPAYITRLAKGDKEAFEWIYKNYCKKIYEYALLITAETETSEDIVQEVFIALWEKRTTLKTISNFNAYIYAMTRNFCISGIRKKNCRQSHLREYGLLQPAHSPGIDPLAETKKAQMKWLMEKTAALPPQQKLVLELRQEGFRFAEIAKQMNLAVMTVKNHRSCALKILKKQSKHALL